jgi:hypothetical protein
MVEDLMPEVEPKEPEYDFTLPPLLRTPDGIPEGWYVTVEDGIPVLAKRVES